MWCRRDSHIHWNCVIWRAMSNASGAWMISGHGQRNGRDICAIPTLLRLPAAERASRFTILLLKGSRRIEALRLRVSRRYLTSPRRMLTGHPFV